MTGKIYGLIGETLKHSWSVPIHHELGCEAYRLYELKAEEQHILATLVLTEREACKPGMLIEALASEAGINEEIRILITRTALLGMDSEEKLVPLETL